jgi:hypothetical protein
LQIEAHQLAFFHDAIHRMQKKGKVEFEPGLKDSEIRLAELIYHFRFPPDLRAFLQIALPVAHWDYYGNRSSGFPNWRDISGRSRRNIQKRLNWSREDLAIDIENRMWGTNWGENPKLLDDALTSVRSEVRKAPLLIPVFSHRYIPAEPEEVGNPVFSVVQSDIVCYRYDFASYLCKEFHEAEIPIPEWAATKPRAIKLWSDAATRNDRWVRLGLNGLD